MIDVSGAFLYGITEGWTRKLNVSMCSSCIFLAVLQLVKEFNVAVKRPPHVVKYMWVSEDATGEQKLVLRVYRKTMTLNTVDAIIRMIIMMIVVVVAVVVVVVIVVLKVNFFLEQTMKALKWSRGITLLFLEPRR
jgi:hypothetical protein